MNSSLTHAQLAWIWGEPKSTLVFYLAEGPPNKMAEEVSRSRLTDIRVKRVPEISNAIPVRCNSYRFEVNRKPNLDGDREV